MTSNVRPLQSLRASTANFALLAIIDREATRATQAMLLRVSIISSVASVVEFATRDGTASYAPAALVARLKGEPKGELSLLLTAKNVAPPKEHPS